MKSSSFPAFFRFKGKSKTVAVNSIGGHPHFRIPHYKRPGNCIRPGVKIVSTKNLKTSWLFLNVTIEQTDRQSAGHQMEDLTNHETIDRDALYIEQSRDNRLQRMKKLPHTMKQLNSIWKGNYSFFTNILSDKVTRQSFIPSNRDLCSSCLRIIDNRNGLSDDVRKYRK